MSFTAQKILQVRNLSAQVWGEVQLPASKSETNRILILEALSHSKVICENASEARDTLILRSGLTSRSLEINVEDAGTAMRFLTAYFCISGQHKIVTGTPRMCMRPIAILVEALQQIGFDIAYKDKEGFPPIEIKPVGFSLLKSEVYIAGNISSQYISALLMIAAVLPDGLTLRFTTDLSSKPYIDMTLGLLSKAGIRHEKIDKGIRIAKQEFKEVKIAATADWSAASYWFSMAALSDKADFILKGLTFDTAQGDKIISKWTKVFGVETQICEAGLKIISNASDRPAFEKDQYLHFDFKDYPDLAQTMIVLCAARGVNATFSGLESLRIKETDRILALQTEIKKFGVELFEVNERVFTLSGRFAISGQTIQTYDDHRMAMAFAPLAVLGHIHIRSPYVVAKSYPSFWEEMSKAGFYIT